jgi:hypothetical protein
MDWQRLGEVFDAWALAIDGKHAVYVEERAGEWFIYFSVSRSKGLMLAQKAVQERLTGAELENGGDAKEFGRKLAEKMRTAFD